MTYLRRAARRSGATCPRAPGSRRLRRRRWSVREIPLGANGKEMSTTMAFVRMLTHW